jgi:hypothetical protein
MQLVDRKLSFGINDFKLSSSWTASWMSAGMIRKSRRSSNLIAALTTVGRTTDYYRDILEEFPMSSSQEPGSYMRWGKHQER